MESGVLGGVPQPHAVHLSAIASSLSSSILHLVDPKRNEFSVFCFCGLDGIHSLLWLWGGHKHPLGHAYV